MPTPQKLSLPRKLSKLSPTEIANLLSPIESFEGPIDVTVMIPTDRLHKELGRRGPVLVLLGDFHSGDKKCVKICDPDSGCYSLYRPSTFLHFIDTLAKKHFISADIFLEFWVPGSTRVALSKGEAHFSSESDSALFEAVLESAPCTSHAANFCPFPHVRTHLSDPRNIDLNSKYNGEAIFSTLHMMASCDIYEYQTRLEALYPGFRGTYLISLMSKMCTGIYTMQDFFSEPFFQKYSRVHHEWSQLPLKVQKAFLKKSKTILKKVAVTHRLRSEIFFQKLIHESVYDPKLNPHSDRLKTIPIYTHLVDIYTIARALKPFRGGLESQLSVMYFGAYHTEAIQTLVGSYYKVSKTYGRKVRITKHTTKQDLDLLPKCIRKTKICSGNKARPNEAKYIEAKEVASDYGISTKGKKGDVCRRLIANHLAVPR